LITKQKEKTKKKQTNKQTKKPQAKNNVFFLIIKNK
jgi:hypothetical protein